MMADSMAGISAGKKPYSTCSMRPRMPDTLVMRLRLSALMRLRGASHRTRPKETCAPPAAAAAGCMAFVRSSKGGVIPLDYRIRAELARGNPRQCYQRPLAVAERRRTAIRESAHFRFAYHIFGRNTARVIPPDVAINFAKCCFSARSLMLSLPWALSRVPLRSCRCGGRSTLDDPWRSHSRRATAC